MTRMPPCAALALLLTISLAGCASTKPCADLSVPRLPPPASLMQPARSPETARQLNEALNELNRLLKPTLSQPARTPSS